MVIKRSGVAAVLAPSFPRICFRNRIDVGLPLVICDTAAIQQGDRPTVDLASDRVVVADRNIELKSQPRSKEAVQILGDGGIRAQGDKHGDCGF